MPDITARWFHRQIGSLGLHNTAAPRIGGQPPADGKIVAGFPPIYK